MPFTANRAFKAAPRLLVSAKGMHYTDADGKQVLDGTAGLWCVNAGHCRDQIANAVRAQVGTLDYAPPFQMGHPLAFELAREVAKLTPAGLNRIFFGNSGSEAVDTALKIALAYFQAKGEPTRRILVGRQRGYHGVGFGGISVGGLPANAKQFATQLLPHIDHLPHTHDARNAFTRGQPQHGAELADALEAMVAKYGPSTIAAVIVEPMAGSTGVLLPPKGYLERLRAICDTHGILLIFDEVITGFGRMGTPFGAQRFGVTPDMITMAKGITNATVPMGAVAAREQIYNTIVDSTEAGIELFHGYTYSGHPVAAAAGLATLALYREEALFDRVRDIEPTWMDAALGLRSAGPVVDIRTMGLVAAFELEPRAGKPGARAFDVFLRCFQNGLLVRATGDTIALSPPLIIEENHIGQMMETLGDAIRSVA
jgi:beta-alanine--pyruvate transaminase